MNQYTCFRSKTLRSQNWHNRSDKYNSLRSKRFGKAFRTFDALFRLFGRGKIGAGAKKCGDLLFAKDFIHQLSHCEFIQLRKCQEGVFQNRGVCGQALPLLASPPHPHCFHQCCARPNFCAAKKRKTPPTGGKPYGNACYAG